MASRPSPPNSVGQPDGEVAALAQRPVEAPVVHRAGGVGPLDDLGGEVLGDEGPHLGSERLGLRVEAEVHPGPRRAGRRGGGDGRGARRGVAPAALGDQLQLPAGVAEQQPGGLGPPHVQLHVVLEHEAVAAVHVEAEPGRLVGHLRRSTRTPGRRAGRRSARPRRGPTRPRRRGGGCRRPARAGRRSGAAGLWKLPIGTPNWWRSLAYCRPRSSVVRARPAWATAVRARHSSSARVEGGLGLGAAVDDVARPPRSTVGHGQPGQRRAEPVSAAPSCATTRSPSRARMISATAAKAVGLVGVVRRGAGAAWRAPRPRRSAGRATSLGAGSPSRPGQQAGHHGGLDQRDEAEVGAVDLDGRGEVGQRRAGAAAAPRGAPWWAGPSPRRRPRARGRSPRGSSSRTRSPCGFLGVETQRGLSQGVLVGGEGEVHRSCRRDLTGRQIVCHHPRRHGRSAASPARGRRHRGSGRAGLHGAHRRLRLRPRPPVGASTCSGRGRSSAPPGAGPRSSTCGRSTAGTAGSASAQRTNVDKAANSELAEWWDEAYKRRHRRVRPPLAGRAGMPRSGLPGCRRRAAGRGSSTSCPRCAPAPAPSTWPPRCRASGAGHGRARDRARRPVRLACSSTPRCAPSGPPTSPPTPLCCATATRGPRPPASGAPAGGRSS